MKSLGNSGRTALLSAASLCPTWGRGHWPNLRASQDQASPRGALLCKCAAQLSTAKSFTRARRTFDWANLEHGLHHFLHLCPSKGEVAGRVDGTRT